MRGIKSELSEKLSDGVRERTGKGNERLLSCWALANKRVLFHYSRPAQYTGQSGDNECGVWCLAFLPSSCTSCLPTLLFCFAFLHPSCTAVFFFLLHRQQCFYFCRCNCPPVCFAPWFVVVQMYKLGNVFHSALFISELIGQLFTFTVNAWFVWMKRGDSFNQIFSFRLHGAHSSGWTNQIQCTATPTAQPSAAEGAVTMHLASVLLMYKVLE